MSSNEQHCYMILLGFLKKKYDDNVPLCILCNIISVKFLLKVFWSLFLKPYMYIVYKNLQMVTCNCESYGSTTEWLR